VTNQRPLRQLADGHERHCGDVASEPRGDSIWGAPAQQGGGDVRVEDDDAHEMLDRREA
jgi:hypothetical protein